MPPAPPWNLLRASRFGHDRGGGTPVYYAVGRIATVLVLATPSGFRIRTNGLPEALVTSRGGVPGAGKLVQWLGALPTLARPDARSMLVIGLGGGSHLEAIPSAIQSIDVVELEPEVIRANQILGPKRRRDPLSDPRIRLIANDARGSLLLTDKRYDAIVSQPSHPWTAGSSHLYTREFFELARDHLNPDGVLLQWMGLSFVDEPLLRTLVATLLEVFPHVMAYRPVAGGMLFLAGEHGDVARWDRLSLERRPLDGPRRANHHHQSDEDRTGDRPADDAPVS